MNDALGFAVFFAGIYLMLCAGNWIVGGNL